MKGKVCGFKVCLLARVAHSQKPSYRSSWCNVFREQSQQVYTRVCFSPDWVKVLRLITLVQDANGTVVKIACGPCDQRSMQSEPAAE